jgi:protein-tyrosine kinase
MNPPQLDFYVARNDPDEVTGAAPGTHAIGRILIDLGTLALEDVDRVLAGQRLQRLRFGEAACKLGLIHDADVRRALRIQSAFCCTALAEAPIAKDVVMLSDPASATAEALRTTAAQIMLWQRAAGTPRRKSIAVLSANRREGRSYIAANLAVALALQANKVLLVDADLRHPKQNALFNLGAERGLADMLDQGRVDLPAIVRSQSLPNLCVLSGGSARGNALELLARPTLNELFALLEPAFDIVVVDTPASCDSADASVVAAQLGNALVVTKKHVTRYSDALALKSALIPAACAVIGVVLNQY